MPTYRNDNNRSVYVDGSFYGPGEVFETYKIVNVPGVVKLSDEPILPLALREDVVTASSAGEELYVDVSVNDCKRIVVTDLTVRVELRANVPSTSNPYKLTANAGDTVSIEQDSEIERLYIKFIDDAGSCRVIQFKE